MRFRAACSATASPLPVAWRRARYEIHTSRHGIEPGPARAARIPTTAQDPRCCWQAAGEFDAVFVATGAWVSRKLGVPARFQDVWPGLTSARSERGPKADDWPQGVGHRRGDVAMDAARCARRLLRHQRGSGLSGKREEMPAHSWEANEALEEGVVFHPGLRSHQVVHAERKVSGVSFRACTRVFDDNRRFAPTFDDAQVTNLDADTVIVTIGQALEVMAPLTAGPGGRIVSDRETLGDQHPACSPRGRGVGPASLVERHGQGHRAATTIDSFLAGPWRKRAPRSRPRPKNSRPLPKPTGYRRATQDEAGEPEERVRGFGEIDVGYTYEDGRGRAKRCLLRSVQRVRPVREGLLRGRHRARHAAGH